MKTKVLFLFLGMIWFVPNFSNAQWSIHADGVYHSTIVGAVNTPNKIRNFGAKLGAGYGFNEFIKTDFSIGIYNFASINGEFSDGGEDVTDYTTFNLHNQTRGYYVEPTLLLYVVPNLLYFKTGPYFGVNQIQSNSGEIRRYSYYSNPRESITPFNYSYTKGYDRGMIIGSGLQLLHQQDIVLDFEVLFRFGRITSTKTDLIKNTQTINYRMNYLAFMPSFKLSYNFTKPNQK